MAHEIDVVMSAHLLRTRQVATMLSLDKATVLRKVKSGELQAIRLAPNCLRFTHESVAAFLAAKAA